MSLHSPKPWKLAGDIETRLLEKQTEIYAADDRLCEPIAIIPHDDVTDTGVPVIIANAHLIIAAPNLLDHLCEVLEWARGLRGSKHLNPYCVPEVKAALQFLATSQGVSDWRDAKTKGGAA